MRKSYANKIGVLTTTAVIWALLLLFWYGRNFLDEGLRESMYCGLKYLYALPYAAGALVGGSSYGPDKFVFIFALGVQSFGMAAIGVFLFGKARVLACSQR